MIGPKRVKVKCELVELQPGRKLVWQLRRPLPAAGQADLQPAR
jgi:hypothetical protein